MKVALAGLSLAGKTALFDALSMHVIDSQTHPARADHPNIAAVKIPDERVDWLTVFSKSAKSVFASMELIDLPGLVLGSEGAADRPRLLGHLRQADALVYCLRAFQSGAVPPPKGSVNPKRDYDDIRGEYLFADLDTVLKRLEKIETQLRKSIPKKEAEQNRREQELLLKCREALEKEHSLRPLLEKSDDAALVRGYCFLTQKPAVIVLNVDEAGLKDPAAIRAPFENLGLPVYTICAQGESDILGLPAEEQPAFLAELGITELQSRRLVHDIHKALDEIVFLTTGEDESRAWPIPRNATAAEAAGAIHSDLQRGFIRAEVMAFADLKAAGSEKAVRAAGKFRLEGRDYLVQDGDILVIRSGV